jgi:uncharacterized protein
MASSVSSDANIHPVAQRIRRPGPKHILALDAGGLRGVVTLAFLERIETVLAEYYGNPQFRLRDHFDMIGGTSTGSIIASALALGWPVSKIRTAYHELGWQMLKHRFWRLGIIRDRFSGKAIDAGFHQQFGDAKLGGRDITTALVIIAKRLDSGSVWILHNNPYGRYYDRPKDDDAATPNKDLLLSRLIRASSAAPTYAGPAFIEVAKGVTGFFIDGAASPYGTPALLLFLVATVPAYGYNWPTGEDVLHLTSIGTGQRRATYSIGMLRWLPSSIMGTLALTTVMNDCSLLSHMTLQSMSSVGLPWVVDSEAGAIDHPTPKQRRQLSYVRFELPLNRQWLEAQIGQRFTEKELNFLARIDNPQAMEKLYELGSAAAEQLVRRDLLFAGMKPASP